MLYNTCGLYLGLWIMVRMQIMTVLKKIVFEIVF